MAKSKLNKRERESNKVVIVQGKRMTAPERNMLMKLDYINGGLTLSALADKYGMSENSVYEISRREKWVKQKKDMTERINAAAEQQFVEVYASCGVEINLMYNNTWQKLINLCNQALNEPQKYLMNKDGSIRYGAIQVLADIIDKAQKGQQFTTGFIGREASAKLEMQREMVILRKKLAGDDDEQQLVQDNFMEALEGINADLWGEDNE